MHEEYKKEWDFQTYPNLTWIPEYSRKSIVFQQKNESDIPNEYELLK